MRPGCGGSRRGGGSIAPRAGAAVWRALSLPCCATLQCSCSHVWGASALCQALPLGSQILPPHFDHCLLQVGGGGMADAVQQLLSDPSTWAFAAAAALAVAGRQLTPTLALLTSQLAVAHGPLALLALGLTLELAPPQPRQVGGCWPLCVECWALYSMLCVLRLYALLRCTRFAAHACLALCSSCPAHALLHAPASLCAAAALHTVARLLASCTPAHGTAPLHSQQAASAQ